MFYPKTVNLQFGLWQRLLPALRALFPKFMLPFFIPIILYSVAYGLFYFSLVTADSIKELRASYPRAYQTISSNSERWPETGQIEILRNGDSATVHVEVGHLTDFRARYIWLTASLTFLIAAITAVAISGWIIWPNLKDRRFLYTAASYLAVSLITLSLHARNLYLARSQVFPDWTWHLNILGVCLVSTSHLDILGMHLVFDPLKDLDLTFQGLVWNVHAGCLVILSIVTLMLATAAAATLAAPPNGEQPTPAFLAEQMERGQIFLYTACTFLTIGLIYTAVWNRWPVELLPNGDLRNKLAAYITVAVAANGVVASLLLIGAYAPMALIHRAQARKIALGVLAAQRGEKRDVSVRIPRNVVRDFLENNRLTIPLYSQLQRIGAMLLPALVSPMISVFATLTSGS